MARENLSSRIGFIFLAAGCAIGLGNIWRFPFITGQSGGGMFVLLYLLFLAILGFPILVMELALGRAAQQNLIGAYRKLAVPAGRFRWHWGGYVFFSGNLLLMMFYTTVSGWLLAYAWGYLNGDLMAQQTPELVNQYFLNLIGDPLASGGYLLLVVLLATVLCACGLQRGVESSVKVMMALLFSMLLVLALRALTLPGAGEGLRFYLAPDLDRLRETGVARTVYNAMGQAFFTLSLGVGSMAIFGSYIKQDHSLTKESIWIILLDTTVALLAGCIIFPVCFSFDVNVSSGPGLIFQSIPNIFVQLAGGRWWGVLFFLFLALAALTTVVAVFENLIAFVMDEFQLRRTWASALVGVAVFVLSLPCALGFNLLSWIQPLGPGSTVLDLEDFIVSQNLLPLGSLFALVFCVSRYGWGWDKFVAEADAGHGLRFPRFLRWYLCWVLPLIILTVFVCGYWEKFF